MKLKAFGNEEPPEWLPVNVIFMSRYSEKCIKRFTEAVIDSILTGTLKFSYIRDYIATKDQIGEVKAILGSLRLILINAVRNNITEVMLASDLQMLGLPYTYQLAIFRPYSEHKIDLVKVLSEDRLLMSTDLSFDWHVEAMISDNDGRYICNNIVISMASDNGFTHLENGKQSILTSCEFSLTENMYYSLSQQLREANALMTLHSPSLCLVSSNKHSIPHHSQCSLRSQTLPLVPPPPPLPSSPASPSLPLHRSTPC